MYFDEKMKGNDWEKFQAFIDLNNQIYTLACLPAEREGVYPSAYKLLEAYKSVLDYILAFTLNKQGSEYCILIPQITHVEDIERVIDVFVKEDHRVWTNTGFENQNPKYICNPKIWFYENNQLIEE